MPPELIENSTLTVSDEAGGVVFLIVKEKAVEESRDAPLKPKGFGEKRGSGRYCRVIFCMEIRSSNAFVNNPKIVSL